MADSDKSVYNLRYNQITSNLEAFGGGSPQWTNVTLNNVDPTQVPVTRLINTVAPLTGGGNLTADRTISIPQATSSIDGYLFHTDWTTFNSKLTSILNSANIFVGNGSNVAVGVPLSGDASLSNAGALTFNTVNGNVGTFTNVQLTVNAKGLITAASSGTIGNLTDAGTDGIVVTGGIGAVLGTGTSLAQHVADTTHNGYLSSTDWNTFNGKQAAGNYITALTGDVTATGPGSVAATLATVNGNVGSFTYASITVNAKGLVTAASSGTAPVTSVSGTAGDISSTGGTTPVLDLVNTAVTPNTYTNATLTVDSKGRLTAASSGTAPVTSVSGTTNQITSTGGTTPVLAIANPLTLPGAMTAGGNIAMASNKITGMAAATANGDAVRFEQTVLTSTDQTITGVKTFSGQLIGKGTATNDSASAGFIGEYIAATASTTNYPTSGTSADLTTLPLTAGDWDVSSMTYTTANGASVTSVLQGIGTASGDDLSGITFGDNGAAAGIVSAANNLSISIPSYRISLTGNTTYHLKYRANFTVATPQAAGRISARRAR